MSKKSKRFFFSRRSGPVFLLEGRVRFFFSKVGPGFFFSQVESGFFFSKVVSGFSSRRSNPGKPSRILIPGQKDSSSHRKYQTLEAMIIRNGQEYVYGPGGTIWDNKNSSRENGRHLENLGPLEPEHSVMLWESPATSSGPPEHTYFYRGNPYLCDPTEYIFISSLLSTSCEVFFRPFSKRSYMKVHIVCYISKIIILFLEQKYCFLIYIIWCAIIYLQWILSSFPGTLKSS